MIDDNQMAVALTGRDPALRLYRCRRDPPVVGAGSGPGR
jgi:hypothetical protein